MSFGKFTGEKANDKSIPPRVGGEETPKTTTYNYDASTKQSDAYLGSSSKVVGTLTFDGPVELAGQVEGEVHAKAKLTITQSALIKAKVMGTEVNVSGTVIGDIVASKSLSLRKPAKIQGNIITPSLSIEEGVVFQGGCEMGTVQGKADGMGKSSVVSDKLDSAH